MTALTIAFGIIVAQALPGIALMLLILASLVIASIIDNISERRRVARLERRRRARQ